MSAQDLKVTLAVNGQPAAEVRAACGVIGQEDAPIARVDAAGPVWDFRGEEPATGPALVLDAERLGYLVRELRAAAGLTRAAMGDAVNLSEADLKALELGRRVTAPTLRAVLAHPAMRDLPEQAQRQGLDLESFSEYKLAVKGNKAGSIETTGYRLRRFFTEPGLSVQLLTPHRCASYYEKLTKKQSVDTHRATLSEARTFCRWLIKKNHLCTNPTDGIEPVGRRRN